MTGRKSATFDALPAFRRYGGIGLMALAAMVLAACGDDSESAEGEQQTITSAGSGGSGSGGGSGGSGDSGGTGGSGGSGGSGDSGGTGGSGGTDGSSGSNPPPSPPPVQNQAPWVAGSAPDQAMADQQYSFTPSAGDPEGDALTFRVINRPRWAVFSPANGRLSGTPTAADAGSYANIDIEVSDGQGTSRLGAFTIDVVVTASGSISISWLPATERVDGSPLTNIDGHRIHWGTSPGNYTSSVFVPGAGITAHVIDNLLPASYYVAATTVDTNGMESALSDAVTIAVQ